MEYFQQMLRSSSIDILRLREEVENLTRQRDAAGALEAFCNRMHANMLAKQDALKQRMEGLHAQLRMALALRAAGYVG